ncbi:MAG: Rrf2 family transcriptional regulator [Planctomycetota bacterium]|nr:Rrf2 family transcriptional regulator [Planctomycetota bacterium]
MLLNQTAVYGLRAMATLASLAPGENLTAEELATRTGVPQQYLSKVMRKLVVARLVAGRRGHGGGFTLLRPARDIRLADVLAAVDLDVDGGCAFGFTSCDPKNPCVLHPIWSRLKDSLAQWTAGSTLADLGPAPRVGRQRRS